MATRAQRTMCSLANHCQHEEECLHPSECLAYVSHAETLLVTIRHV